MLLRQTIRHRSTERHIHAGAYASVVLEGGYEEAGDHGRFHVRAGDVIFHDRFEAHLDRFHQDGAIVLNLGIPDTEQVATGYGRLDNIDLLVRIAEKDPRDGLHFLSQSVPERAVQCHDWEDQLCRSMKENPALRITEWAEQTRLAPWVVSRGFKRVFGVTPESFRARTRAKAAWERIRLTEVPLARIALECGYTDQAHMTHSIRELTARTPTAWRPANGYKTASARNFTTEA